MMAVRTAEKLLKVGEDVCPELSVNIIESEYFKMHPDLIQMHPRNQDEYVYHH